jgi:hypothetical protein
MGGAQGKVGARMMPGGLARDREAIEEGGGHCASLRGLGGGLH